MGTKTMPGRLDEGSGNGHVNGLLRPVTQRAELACWLNNGEIKPREVEGLIGGDSNFAAEIRRLYLEMQSGTKTVHIGSHTIDLNKSHGATTANEIGAVQVTLTLAGQLAVKGTYASGNYPIILAKEEGMLTEGLSRGIGVLNAAGGVTSAVYKDGMARDILVSTDGVLETTKLIKWINSGVGELFMRAEFNKHVGDHGEFVSAEAHGNGKDVHIRFVGTTGAANGMNKVTIASSKTVNAMIEYLKGKEMEVDLVSESGNMCTDKKPSQINSIEGRGVSVLAEATISKEIVASKFKGVSASDIAELNKRKNLVGSAMAGAMGFNAHIANILAGIYGATGQDMAHIISGSQGITDMHVDRDGNLYVSVRMPTIEVATYGGATRNETHKEVLQLMGLYGEGDHDGVTRLAFAEVIAAACIAGELNLIAVQAEKELALSHGSLRRT